MRIGFSGAGGTGKTTQALYTSKKINFEYVDESVRHWLKEHGIGHFSEATKEQIRDMQEDVLRHKCSVEPALKNFVADRTTVDNAAYVLYWNNREDGEWQRWVNEYVQRAMIHAIQCYDIIFFFPTGKIPFESDGLRSTKPCYHMTIEAIIAGLMSLANLPCLILEGTTVEERHLEIIKACSVHMAMQATKASRLITPTTEQILSVGKGGKV